MRALPRPVRSPVCRCTLAAHAPRPLREAARSPSLSSVPGVYALFDSSRRLQYVGLSSDLAASLAAHDAALGSNDASFVAAKPLPGAKQAALRDAWRAWVDEAGGPPPRQGDAAWRAAAPTRRRSDAAAAAAPRAALDAAAWRRADTAALLEAHHSALVSLVERGFAVLDGALSPDVVAAARAEAESLSASGGLVSASQGPRRGDSLAVLRFRPSAEPSTCSDAELISLHPRADANAQIQALQRGGTPGLGAAARLLASLASAVSESLGGQSRLAFQGDAPPPSLPRFPALAPAAAMQLAVYAPGGAGYLRHFDALPQEKSAAGATDLGAADAAAGPVGERVCDRVLTAILYLNPDWVLAHGGRLRLWPASPRHLPSGDERSPATRFSQAANTEEPSPVDVDPIGGRLLLFDAAAVEHEVAPCSGRRRWALSAWLPAAPG